MMPEPFILVLAKALVAAGGVLLFLLPITTPPGLVAGLVGTIAGYLLARRAASAGLRLPAGLFLSAVLIGGARLAGQWILDGAPVAEMSPTIHLSDAVFFGAGCLGVFFGLRMLSQTARVFSLLEVAVVVGAAAHVFAPHRHQRIHEPRFLSDWAWSQGIDPVDILTAAGVVAIVLAILLLLQTRRAAKVLLTLLLLFALGVASYYLFGHNVRLVPQADDNGLGLSGKDKNKDDDSSSSKNKPPDPVAVVLLHDELPDAPVLYFRQAVLSRFAVDRLVEDPSGKFDRDVFTRFPSGGALHVDSPQDPAAHREVHTSMFLLVDHAQPVGIGHPIELRPLENPDPRRFVVAYDVDSRFLPVDETRLVGRTSLPPTWSEEQRLHYTALPADPRYKALSNRLVRDVDPRFVGDDLMKAMAIKRYLETEGFYSLKQKTLVGDDPTGKFLFGDLRGYCVHFAHAAVFLMRSQGIPARVALGYAVQTMRRGAGSSILILGSEAHAWPEMYVDGVGWVTFDIYPERSDEPPPPPFDGDLESVLGELARKDKTGGKAADPSKTLVIPWGAIRGGAAGILGGILALAYAVKLFRRLRRSSHRLVYRGVLDHLSDLGAARAFGETREGHARRLLALTPTFTSLTHEHLRQALGRGEGDLRPLARTVGSELRRNTTFWTRLGATLNPIGWWFTR